MRTAAFLVLLVACTEPVSEHPMRGSAAATATATAAATAPATDPEADAGTDAATAPAPVPVPAPAPFTAFPAQDAASRTFIILGVHEDLPVADDMRWMRHETPNGDILLVSPETPVAHPRTFTFASPTNRPCIAVARTRALVAHGIGESDRGWEHGGTIYDALVAEGCAEDDDARRVAIEGERPALRWIESETIESVDDERLAPRRLAALAPSLRRADVRGAAWVLRIGLPGTGLEALDAGPFDPVEPGDEMTRLFLVNSETHAVAATYEAAYVRALVADGDRTLIAIDTGPERVVLLEAQAGVVREVIDAVWPIGDFGCDC